MGVGARDRDEGLVVYKWIQEGVNEMDRQGASRVGSCGGAKERKLMVQKRRNLE